MIKLNNISKYYHSEGTVALGLRKINLELNVGEFVAITGESGSGKSTLLNVISGNDTYEEGEMYINGEETSHFIESEWENYRRNYIGFIFQNNNLIDSYTVYENVLAALIVQGINKKLRRIRAKEIIERVGLTSHLKHKAIKLSGGQKQRLAIARALAKDVPIIVADEPTGNLDSESGSEIIKLLNEVSKDKLVIIVTHNFEQTKDFVSRKIRLFDGEVVEDIELKDVTKMDKITVNENQNTVIKKSILFGLLNLKSQPVRTLFLLIVTLIVTLFIFNLYGEHLMSQDNSGAYLSMFSSVNNNYKERIIVSKKDKTAFTNADYEYINSISKVDRVIKQDLALDCYTNISFSSGDEYYYFDGYPYPNEYLKNTDLEYGVLPNGINEIVIKSSLYSGYKYLNQLNKVISMKLTTNSGQEHIDVKIVGFINESVNIDVIYVSSELLDYINTKQETENSENTIEVFFSPFRYSGLVSIDTSESVIYYQHTVEANFEDINAVIKVLLKNGYYAFSPYTSISDPFSNMAALFVVLSNAFSTLSTIFGIFVIYFVAFLILKYFLLFKKKDYAILKSIGIDQNSIRVMNFVELYFAFLVSFVLLIPLYFVLLKSDVNSSGFLFYSLTYYKWYHFIFLLLINTLICILIVRRYNKLLIKNSILSNMRVE